MAILKKRRATSALPEVTTERGVVIPKRPSEKLTSTVGTRPDVGTKGATAGTKGAGKGAAPLISKTTTGVRPSGALTSAVKGTPGVGTTTGTKPVGTGATKGTTLTTKLAGTERPALTKKSTTTGGASKLTSALSGALLGAGAGVAGKAVYDKLFGTKKDTSGGTKGGTSGGTKGGTSGGTKGGTTGGTKGGTTSGTKGGTTGGTKGGTSGGTKGGTTGGTKGGTKTPPKSAGGTKTAGGTGAIGGIGQGDQTEDLSHGTPYDDDGNLMPGWELDENNNPVWVGTGTAGDVTNEDGSITHADGTTTYTYDDGSTITVNADGEIVSSTDASGESTDYTAGTDAEEETFGGRQNEDGTITYTMDDGSTITVDANGNVVASTDEYGESVDVSDNQYYEDDSGNLYDADGNLVYDAGAGMWTSDEGYGVDTAENYTDEDGNVYSPDGTLIYDANAGMWTDDEGYADYYADTSEDENLYDTEGNLYAEEDIPEEEVVAEDDYNGDDYWGKKGGLVALMNQGGDVRGYADGDLVTAPFVDEDAADVEYFDDGSYIVTYGDNSYITYDENGEIYQVNGADDSQAVAAMDVIQGSQDVDTTSTEDTGYGPNVQVFDDGSRIETFDDGTTITYDSDGNIYSTTDTEGNVIKMGGLSSVGTGSVRDYYKTPEYLTKQQELRQQLEEKKKEGEAKSQLDKLIESITGSGYLGAGAAGAAIGALLSNSDLFGGSTQDRNAGVDMSKVGLIPARTTEFGIGPARYVTYGEYGARDQMPDLYGDELYRNLNAPGFNPVNEGDYGYVQGAENALGPLADGSEENQEVTQDDEGAERKMADGGAAGGTYFTFGRPVDPLQNLMNPQPSAPAPTAPMGGLGAQQAKPQMPMPQVGQVPAQPQMMQSMRRGGLPALSNVPFAKGRLDFRQGSAVHGPGDGQSDDIPAMLADGEYVIDAETVAQIGNGSTKAGAKALDEFRQNIRKHKRSAPLHQIPPKTKPLTSYLKKGK